MISLQILKNDSNLKGTSSMDLGTLMLRLSPAACCLSPGLTVTSLDWAVVLRLPRTVLTGEVSCPCLGQSESFLSLVLDTGSLDYNGF